MKRRRLFVLNLVERFFSWEKSVLPHGLFKSLFKLVNIYFEEEAIDCYFFDHQDIGFFETFILGSDETKKIAKDSNKTIHAMKKSEMLEKLSGYVVHQDKHLNEEKEVVKDSITSKKKKVVEVLKKKGEIIKYLGRRIVIKDEHLYEKLERMYNRFSEELQARLKTKQSPSEPPTED